VSDEIPAWLRSPGVPEPEPDEAERIASLDQSKTAQTVAAALANPAGSGGRHQQMKSLVLSLLEIGLSDKAIFTQFRSMLRPTFLMRKLTQLSAGAGNGSIKMLLLPAMDRKTRPLFLLRPKQTQKYSPGSMVSSVMRLHFGTQARFGPSMERIPQAIQFCS
jgi:hypothetical protein